MILEQLGIGRFAGAPVVICYESLLQVVCAMAFDYGMTREDAAVMWEFDASNHPSRCKGYLDHADYEQFPERCICKLPVNPYRVPLEFE